MFTPIPAMHSRGGRLAYIATSLQSEKGKEMNNTLSCGLHKSQVKSSPAYKIRTRVVFGSRALSRIKGFSERRNCSSVRSMSESRLESLPMELLVRIICHLRHDQLTAVLLVSKTIKNAVLVARQSHFNYTTPSRSRVGVGTPPAEHLSLHSRGDGKVIRTPSPRTPPSVPRRRRPRSRLNFSDQLLSESLPLDRALSYGYEDELSQGVDKIELR